jgi:ribosomal protein L22
MADRKGGKVAGDAGTKQDKPSAEEGKGTPEKVAVEAAEAKAAEQAPAKAAPKKRAPRKPATPKAEATAAEETGVGKEEAEAAEKAPSGQRANPSARTRARDKAEGAAAKPRSRSRAKAADAEEGEAAPAGKPRRGAGQPPPAPPVVRAQARYVRTSARKARLVCDHIRGKTVEDAFAILAHTPRSVAEDWRKLLQSAVANAEHNHELLGDDLRVASAHADEGPTLKRFRPRAMGRATRIRKRTSHLTITLTPKDAPVGREGRSR